MSSTGQPRCFIHRITTATPQGVMLQSDVPFFLSKTCPNERSQKLLRRLAGHTGIRKRHLVAMRWQSDINGQSEFYRSADVQPQGPNMRERNGRFDEPSALLVQDLLEPIAAETLQSTDVMVTISCTHASSPGLEAPILAHPAISTDVQRWNLGFMGCSAALAGLRMLWCMDHYRQGLIVACELSSLHFQYTDQVDQMTANLLFSDGAAALLVSGEPSRVGVLDCACVSVPSHADQMLWFATESGLALSLSPELPDTLAAQLPAVVKTFLDRHHMSIGDVDHWLVHPGGPQILDSVEQSLRLEAGALQRSRDVLRDYGNMSSPTILFILQGLVESRERGHAVAIAFGPGLTIELALLTLN